jgi:hypothetical protein
LQRAAEQHCTPAGLADVAKDPKLGPKLETGDVTSAEQLLSETVVACFTTTESDPAWDVTRFIEEHLARAVAVRLDEELKRADEAGRRARVAFELLAQRSVQQQLGRLLQGQELLARGQADAIVLLRQIRDLLGPGLRPSDLPTEQDDRASAPRNGAGMATVADPVAQGAEDGLERSEAPAGLVRPADPGGAGPEPVPEPAGDADPAPAPRLGVTDGAEIACPPERPQFWLDAHPVTNGEFAEFLADWRIRRTSNGRPEQRTRVAGTSTRATCPIGATIARGQRRTSSISP